MKTTGFKLPTVLYAIGFVFFISTLLSSSCSKNDDILSTPGTIAGSWKVSLYFDSRDETSKFTGYTFNFNDGGQLVATNGTNSVTGTWSQASSKLNISFGVTPVFSDLNDDWLIEEKTSTSIRLKDDNLSQDDKLQFTKL
ncbi:MAG TPA: hypothetical protein VK498_13215 [Ferruginibacter sp.]|nr:hypothetical protein [Ferruginibacter sp.]